MFHLADIHTWNCSSANCWSFSQTRTNSAPLGVSQKCAKAHLHEMPTIIVAENSHLFDVLSHVAQALPPLLREERTAQSQVGDPYPLQRRRGGAGSRQADAAGEAA
jgi:hypothetical protein